MTPMMIIVMMMMMMTLATTTTINGRMGEKEVNGAKCYIVQ